MDPRNPAIERARYPELSRITVDALVVWLLAFVFGAAFWALLFHVATPLIVRLFHIASSLTVRFV